MSNHLIIIDPQNDFCSPQGNLFVTGADEDSVRLAAMIDRVGHKLDDIHVTLDTHHKLQVFHPLFWRDGTGSKCPDPFTLISSADIKNGTWIPVIPSWAKQMVDYTEALESNGRYALCIWPEHCLIGTWGHNVVDPVQLALAKWEMENIAMVDYVTKGSNLWTEHYSAVQADVPNDDPTTQLNIDLIETLAEADVIGISGQALSHCVANTIRDIADQFGDDQIQKFQLIQDTTSNVTGFEKLGEDFVNEMVSRGMKLTTSVEFLN